MYSISPDSRRAELAHRRDRIGTSILGPDRWRRTTRRSGRREGPVTGLGSGSGNGATL